MTFCTGELHSVVLRHHMLALGVGALAEYLSLLAQFLALLFCVEEDWNNSRNSPKQSHAHEHHAAAVVVGEQVDNANYRCYHNPGCNVDNITRLFYSLYLPVNLPLLLPHIEKLVPEVARSGDLACVERAAQ